MDLLTHLFLPVAVAYVLRPDLFRPRSRFAVAILAIAPDFDKLLGLPGLFHSLLVTVPVSVVLIGVATYRDELQFGILAVVILHSHLLLDFVDAGPVTFLYPVVKEGVGLVWETRLVLGEGLLGVTIENLLPSLRVKRTNIGRTNYPLIDRYGVVSALLAGALVVGYLVRSKLGGRDR